jgi:transcriptional regulator with XRE-family HTH domain
MPGLADNVQRLMAHEGCTVEELARRCALSRATIKGILAGTQRPQARTLHRLAGGLGVDVDELFQNSATLAQRRFDRATNPAVEHFVRRHPQRFEDWLPDDFDELYSQFGTGGALTEEGVAAVAEKIDLKRRVHAQVDLILETAEAQLLEQMVEVLYRRVKIDGGGPPADP